MASQNLQQCVPASPRKPLDHGRKTDWLCIALLSAVTILTWLPRLQGPIDLRWDAGVYYVLGTSLAQGHGYRLLYEPGQIRAIQYPPLLPALVAMHQDILGTSDPRVVGPWLRKSWFLLSIAYIILVYLLARHFLGPPHAFLLGLICLLNPMMFFLSGLCFTELPFALTTTLFFFLYYKRKHRFLTQCAMPAAAIASYLLRTAGIALLVAWIADALFRRQFRAAAIRALVALVPVLLWQSYVHRVESSEEYKHPQYVYQRDPSMFYNVSYATNVSLRSPFQPDLGKATARDLFARFLGNTIHAPQSFGEEFLFTKRTLEYYATKLNTSFRYRLVPHWSIGLALSAFGLIIVAGIALQFWKGQWLMAIYTLLSIAAVCTTPWPLQLGRYWAPLLPFLLLALFQGVSGIQRLVSQLFPRRQRLAKLFIGLCTLGMALCGSLVSLISLHSYLDPATYQTPTGVEKHYKLLHHPEVFSSIQKSLQWILAGNRNPTAVIAVSMPAWVYLKTGIKTVMPPFEGDASRVQALLDSVPVSYALLEQSLFDGSYNSRFPTLIRNSPDKWRLVYTSPLHDMEVYERVGIPNLASPDSPKRAVRLLF